MINANLSVRGIPGAGSDDPAIDEEWGWIALACAPNTGDYIRVFHGLDFHMLRIKGIMHRAIKLPPPEFGAKEPTIEIEADWVTIDLTDYRLD